MKLDQGGMKMTMRVITVMKGQITAVTLTMLPLLNWGPAHLQVLLLMILILALLKKKTFPPTTNSRSPWEVTGKTAYYHRLRRLARVRGEVWPPIDPIVPFDRSFDANSDNSTSEADDDEVPNIAADSRGNTEHGFNLAALAVGPLPPDPEWAEGDAYLTPPPKRAAEFGGEPGSTVKKAKIDKCGDGSDIPNSRRCLVLSTTGWGCAGCFKLMSNYRLIFPKLFYLRRFFFQLYFAAS